MKFERCALCRPLALAPLQFSLHEILKGRLEDLLGEADDYYPRYLELLKELYTNTQDAENPETPRPPPRQRGEVCGRV